jgi:outer membrane protein TolC
VAVQAARAQVDVLLRQPLTADTAVAIALLSNRGLQAKFAELGIAEADLVQAGRLKNPWFGFDRLAGGGALEIDRSFVFGVLDLLTMPAATQIARARFEQVQLLAAYEAVGLAARTRRAYFEAVAAGQLVDYCSQVQEAADASSELARRMAAAGNFSRLDQLREQAFRDDAVSRLARARRDATEQRERLTRLLGLRSDQAQYTLPERLPELPAAPVEPANAEHTAMARRLDVLAGQRNVEAVARSLGVTQATRYTDGVNAAVLNKDQTGTPHERGYALQVAVPVFDGGSARTARAEALYRQALERSDEVAVNAASEVREAYAVYRTAYELARHYRDEVVPVRRRIGDEELLRYNGMLIGVFELMAQAREQVEALRDYWIADTQLQTALTAGSPAPDPDPHHDAATASPTSAR